jgi:hypothetical protein
MYHHQVSNCGLCRVKAQSSGFAPQAKCCERLNWRFVIPLLSSVVPQVLLSCGPARPIQAVSGGPSDYAAFSSRSRTCVRYPGSVGTWHDPDLGRPIAALLERCAESLGVGSTLGKHWCRSSPARHQGVSNVHQWRRVRPTADARALRSGN